MKTIVLSLPVWLLIFFSSCKKEDNLPDASVIRCNDFETIECLSDNWAGLNAKVQVAEGSYDGSKCLFLTTDSTKPSQSIYTYVEGLDSSKVYRVTLYAKYKKVLPHLPNHGHSINASMYPGGFNLIVFNLNTNSNDPVDQDWKKYTELFETSSSRAGKLSIAVSDMDSVWIDNITITEF